MSGSSLDYKYLQLLYLAEEIDSRLKEGISFHDITLKESEKAEIISGIKTISKDLKKLSSHAKGLECWLSGDTGARDFIKSSKKYNTSKATKQLKSKATSKSKDDEVASFGGLFNSLKPMADEALKECKPKVVHIIKNKIQDINLIQHLLDDLMNLILAGTDEKYYFKLLNYYKTFDDEGYQSYLQHYNEMTS